MWGMDCDILIADVEDLKLLWNCELDKAVSHLPAEIAVIFAAIEGKCLKKIYLECHAFCFTLMGEWIDTNETIHGNLTF